MEKNTIYFDIKLLYIEVMKKKNIVHLSDWLTTEELPFASKITYSIDQVLHDHDFIEIFYIVDGKISHTFNENETKILKTGDMYLLLLKDKHIFNRDDSIATHRDIVIRYDFFLEMCNYLSPHLYEKFLSGELPKHIRIDINKLNELEMRLKDIDNLQQIDISTAKCLSKIIVTELLGLFISFKRIEENDEYPGWLYNLIERFNNPNLLKVGLKEITKPFYYSKEYICRVFKSYLGYTMTDYLVQKRIQEAANMLLTTNEKVEEICNEVGFLSISYFNKKFKQKYHLSPSKYRREMR